MLCCYERFRSGNHFFFPNSGNIIYGYGDVAKLGRFSILGAMEYNLPPFFPSPLRLSGIYLIQTFQYVLLMIIFVKIIARFTSNKFLIYIAPALFSLTPSITIPFFRPLLGDRNIIFYYAVFLYFYLKYLEKPKLYYLVFGVISANMAIHNKEIGFIALGFSLFSPALILEKIQARGENL